MTRPPHLFDKRSLASTFGFAVLAALLVLSPGMALSSELAVGEVDTDESLIETYAAQLSHPDFRIRSEASRQLVRYGRAAIPAATEQALSIDLEASLRGMHILGELFRSSDKATWRATHAALEGIAASSVPRAALRARTILEGHRRFGLARLRNSGGALLDQNRTLQLGADWKGGDDGLLDLRWLPGLHVLRIIKAPITDAALAHLKWVDQLRELSLIDVPVTDQGVSCLKDFDSLKTLYLTDTRVSEAALQYVACHRQMSWLDLTSVRITETGLPYLAQLIHLETLELGDQDMDPADLQSLRKALPDANILLTEEDGRGPFDDE